MKALISYGGGVNSTALIILLFNMGFRYPVVYALTGAERKETDAYVLYFNSFLRDTYGVEIIMISPQTHPHLYEQRIKDKNLNTVEEYCISLGVVPIICIRWCTSGYKRDPIRKWGKENNIFTHLIGFAADEAHRARVEKDGRYFLSYPLIDNGITRQGCIDIINRIGLHVPLKSGCFFCPFQKEREWKYLYHNDPERWERAKNIEKNASKKANRKVTILSNYTSLEEYQKGWEQENPLFPELLDHSRHQCPYCSL